MAGTVDRDHAHPQSRPHGTMKAQALSAKFTVFLLDPLTSTALQASRSALPQRADSDSSHKGISMLPSGRLRNAILAVFMISGATALAYEVVWVRQMTLIMGVSVYAVSAVLSAFMAGLSLGSFAFGRLADRMRRPLVLYACLEAGLALCAVAFPWILDHLTLPLFLAAAKVFPTGSLQIQIARFSIAVASIILPSILIGGTFPVVARSYRAKAARVGRDLSVLYALNTIGAVLGILFVGFVALASVGMKTTLYSTAIVNLLLAAISLVISRAEAVQVTPSPAPAQSQGGAHRFTRTAWICLAVAFLSGFVSLACEVMWNRVLVFYLHNSTYAFSAMLSTYLVGIALGSAILSRFVDRLSNLPRLLGILVILLAFSVLLSVGAVRSLPEVMEFALGVAGLNSWADSLVYLYLQTAFVMLLPTLLLGAIFPLTIRMYLVDAGRFGKEVGFVTSINTLGAVLGSFCAGFILIPTIGLRNAFLLMVTISLLTGLLVWRGFGVWPRKRQLILSLAGLATLVLAWVMVPTRLFYSNYARHVGEILYYEEESTDTVMVTQYMGKLSSRMLVFSDGRGTAGIPTVVEDRFYGHLPMLLHDDPQDVLVICFGVGNTMGAISRHDAARIDCAELSPGVVACADFFPTNRGVLQDPRVSLSIEDGRNYLLTTDQLYDIIHLDPPELHSAGVVSLYTREFYELCRSRLRPGGILSHWINVTLLPEEELRMLVRTFQAVFPHTTIWQGPNRYSWNFIGWDRPLAIDLGVFEEKMREQKVQEDLEEIRLDDPATFLSLFQMSEEGVREYAGAGHLVVDDHSRVDFTIPKSIYSRYGLINVDQVNPAAFAEVRGKHSPSERGGRLSMLLAGLRRESIAPFVTNREAAEGGTDFDQALEASIQRIRYEHRQLILRHEPYREILAAWGENEVWAGRPEPVGN